MSQLAKNTSVLFVFYIINSIVAFLQIKILVLWMDPQEMGLYLTVIAIGALLSVLAQFGMPTVVSRFTAKYDALECRFSLQKLILSSWAIIIFMGLVVISGVLLYSDALATKFYEVPPKKEYIFLASLIFIITALKNVCYSGLNGLRRMEYPVIFECLYLSSFAALSYIFRDSLTVLFLLQLNLTLNILFFVPISTTLISFIRKIDAKRTVEKNIFSEVSPFWVSSFMNGFIGILFTYADQLLISLFLMYQSVVIFYVAVKIVYFFRRILSIPVSALSPEFTRKWELGEIKTLELDFVRIVKVLFSAGIYSATILTLLSQNFVLIVSDQNTLDAAKILFILSLSVPLISIYSPISNFFIAIGEIKLSVIANILWIAVYIFTGAFVLKASNSMLLLAVSQVVASFAVFCFCLYMISKWFSLTSELYNFIKIAVCGLLTAMMGKTIIPYEFANNLLQVLFISGFCFVLFNALLILCNVFSTQDKEKIISIIPNNKLKGIANIIFYWPERLLSSSIR